MERANKPININGSQGELKTNRCNPAFFFDLSGMDGVCSYLIFRNS
jgi:hypothetical protein